MPHLPVNGLDLAVAIVLLISALLAFMRGFVQETLSIAAWIGASFGSLYGLQFVRPTARRLIPIDWAADAAAMIVLFLAILFTLSILINLISRTVQRSALNPLDRSLGFVFGLVRGGVILCIGLIICDWLMAPDQRPDWMKSAKTLPLMEGGADRLKGLLPHTFQRAGDAAKDAAAKVNEAAEAKRTLERLTEPVPQRAGHDQHGAEVVPASVPKATADEIGQKVEELLQNTSAPAETTPSETRP
jgi:membrane protein required for colicin V production